MSNIKRFITFVLVVSILTSFYMVNADALTTVGFNGVFPQNGVVVEDFTDNPAKIFMDDGVSFASVSFTDSGEFDNTTDLRATTQAYNPNRNVSPVVDTTVYMYVSLTAGFSNGIGREIHSEYIAENEPWGRAIALGSRIMPENAYVTQFLALHFARVYEYYEEESAPDGIEENIYCIDDQYIHIRYFE